MFTGIAALAAGTVTTATVLAAVAEVGMILTVVGGVTGNKDLAKIGGVMGLVGGVGSLVAGGVSGASGAAAGAADTGQIVGELGSQAANAGFDTSVIGAATDSIAQYPNAAANLTASLDEPLGTLGSQAAGAGGESVTQTVGAAAPGQTVATAVPDATAGAPQAAEVKTPTGPQGPAGAQAPNTPAAPGATGGTNKNQPVKSDSFFGGITNLLDNNKGLTNTLSTFGLGAFKGVADNSFNNKKLEMMKQQAANANSVVGTGVGSSYNPLVASSVYNRARTA